MDGRLDGHAGPDGLHAGFDRQAVGQDEALGALAVGAEDALGGVVLGMVAENPLAVGEQGGGDGLPLAGRQGPPFPGERDHFGGLRRQDRVPFDAISAHASLLEDALRP